MTQSDWATKALEIREALKGRPKAARRKLFKKLPDSVRKKALVSPYILGRDEQVEALTSEADTILVLSGRGWGKSWSGAHWLLDRIERGHKATAGIAETAADVRDDMVDPAEPGSGIIEFAEDKKLKPNHKISQSRVELKAPHGSSRIQLYSGDSPQSLRGFSGSAVWCDELAKMRYQEAVRRQLDFVLREGGEEGSQLLITTTPRPTQTIKELARDDSVHVIKGTSWDNRANLDDRFIRQLETLQGTRLGRQEVKAQILEDSGDLWSHDDITHVTPEEVPELVRIVVGLDPTVSDEEDSDECGIVVCALGEDEKAYVLEDLSDTYTNREWAAVTVAAFQADLSIDDLPSSIEGQSYPWPPADKIFGERNQGGGLIADNIKSVSKRVAFGSVHVQRPKEARAEPVHSLYQSTPPEVVHVGTHPELEDQMTSFLQGADSPDRVDAAVHALSELLLSGTQPVLDPDHVISK